MPTGYTTYIEDGEITKGKEFLLKCARGFGACIDMKEESLSVDIPTELKPSTYHKRQLENAYIDLEKYKSMILEDAQKILDEEYEKNQLHYRDAVIKNLEVQERYASIRKEISDWNPPTGEHVNLKKFALEQIDMSTDRDMEDYYQEELKNQRKTHKHT